MPRSPSCTLGDRSYHDVDWSVLLLFGGGLTLSVVLGESGASRALAAQLSATTAGLPFFLLVASAVLFWCS